VNVGIAPLLDELGLARQVRAVGSRSRGRSFDVAWHHWATPAGGVRTVQAARIPVNLSHTSVVVGEVLHLECAGRHLWCVAEFPCPEIDLGERELFFSAETDSDRNGGDVLVTGVGLVEETAQTGLSPARFLPGALRDRGKWKLEPVQRSVIEHAAVAVRKRRRGDSILVTAPPPKPVRLDDGGPRLVNGEPIPMSNRQLDRSHDYRRPAGQLEYRPCRIIAVR
jgi:hypothetical protein